MGKTTTVITVETEEIWIIRHSRSFVPSWCPQCAAQTRMVTLAEAVALGGVSSRVIYQRVEAGGIHYAETPAGLLRFCESSLLDPGPQTDPPLPDGLETEADDSFIRRSSAGRLTNEERPNEPNEESDSEVKR